MGRPLSDPAAKKSEVVQSFLTPGERALIDLMARARGQGLSEMVRLTVLEKAQSLFLEDFTGALRLASGTASKPKAVTPSKQASLEAWIGASPGNWRSAQGPLLAEEREQRVLMLQRHVSPEMAGWLVKQGLTLADWTEAWAGQTRLEFCVEFCGYKPPGGK